MPPYSSGAWSRWNISKIRSKYSASIPIPLSATENSHQPPCCSAEIRTSGGTSGRPYLIAFPIRFEKTCSSCVGSAITVGIGPTVTVASASWIGAASVEMASATTAPALIGTGGFAAVSIRESRSRSAISRCMRTPPSTMNAMYSSASGPS